MNPFYRMQGKVIVVALLIAALLSLGVATVRAQTPIEFIVNSTADLVDADIVDDLCDADPGPAVQCTLRAAVIQANATPGKQTIRLQAQLYRLTPCRRWREQQLHRRPRSDPGCRHDRRYGRQIAHGH